MTSPAATNATRRARSCSTRCRRVNLILQFSNATSPSVESPSRRRPSRSRTEHPVRRRGRDREACAAAEAVCSAVRWRSPAARRWGRCRTSTIAISRRSCRCPERWRISTSSATPSSIPTSSPSGTPGAGRRSGLGPLFNAASCDECHNEGAHGRGPDEEGPMPNSMVVQLEAAAAGRAHRSERSTRAIRCTARVLSPAAVEGFMPEGQVHHSLPRHPAHLSGRYRVDPAPARV